MEGREKSDPGYDDWFDEPEPPSDTHATAGRGAYEDAEEVWTLPEDEEPRHRRRHRRDVVIGGRTLTTPQVAIIGVSIVVLFIAILAAAGAFNSASKPVTTPVTTPRTTPPSVTPSTSTPSTSAATAAAPTQTLSPGATGAQVKALQRALATLGYSAGKVDGDYGASTQAAVEQFQVANGLAADGVVGQQTLAKLQQALSG